MHKSFIIIAAVMGLLGVALGAFGAHGLESILEANGRTATFETGNRYHMYHSLGLLAIAWLSTLYPVKMIQWAGYLFIAGIFFFSGSLYILAIFDIGIMGAVAPIGGTAFIIGWGLIGWTALRSD